MIRATARYLVYQDVVRYGVQDPVLEYASKKPELKKELDRKIRYYRKEKI